MDAKAQGLAERVVAGPDVTIAESAFYPTGMTHGSRNTANHGLWDGTRF